MGSHIDTRGFKRKKLGESDDMARRRRATFKQYLQQIEEDLLEDDLTTLDPETPEADQDE